MSIEILEYLDDIGQSPYGKWFEKLNAKAAAKVTSGKLISDPAIESTSAR